MSNPYFCQVFVTEDKPEHGVFSVQFHLPSITITFAAQDLLFAQRVLDFVSETRGSPTYRDVHLGNGIFRHMPEKSIDLSPSFRDTKLMFLKDGEFDSSYVLRIKPSMSCTMIFEIRDEQLDVLLGSIQEIVNDYCETSKGT